MIEFFEDNLGSITLLLTLGTFWMAMSTRSAAVASQRIFELEARPILVFSKPMFRIHQELVDTGNGIKQPVNRALTLGIEFKNSGRVPFRYSVTNIHMTFDCRTVENPTFNTRGGIIYPSDYGTFWLGTLPYNGEIFPPVQGVIEYQVEYEAIDNKRGFRKTEKMSYTVTSFEQFSFDWRYLKDSEEIPLPKS